MSTQSRPAPAFQEYASDMMARVEYRMLSLAQRGLLYTMRLECWVNGSLPESPAVLARLLGFDPTEIAAELPGVMPFFEREDGWIRSPELERYRAHLECIRERKSEGGKRGAAKTNAANKPKRGKGSAGISTGMPAAMSSGVPASESRVSRRDLSRAEPEPSQSGGGCNPSFYEGDHWGGCSGFTPDPELDDERGAA